jgi:ribulose-phosphate 3-epimerase
MANLIKIAPSFLTADLSRLGDEVRAVEAAGADYLHLDVMDGRFVPPITFGALVVATIRRLASLPLDVHLMVERPERHLEAFAEAALLCLRPRRAAPPAGRCSRSRPGLPARRGPEPGDAALGYRGGAGRR